MPPSPPANQSTIITAAMVMSIDLPNAGTHTVKPTKQGCRGHQDPSTMTYGAVFAIANMVRVFPSTSISAKLTQSPSAAGNR